MSKANRGNKQAMPASHKFKPRLLIASGVLLMLLGVYVAVRPNLVMPAKRQELQIAGQKVEIETRRIVAIPRPLSGLVIVGGMGLILISMIRE
jgi:hypothetical protein